MTGQEDPTSLLIYYSVELSMIQRSNGNKHEQLVIQVASRMYDFLFIIKAMITVLLVQNLLAEHVS